MFDKNTVSDFASSALLMENIYSFEYYKSNQSLLPDEQVLKNISFSANKGDIWSIFGNSIFEIKLLLEIMANAKIYEKGRLSINGLDTTERKRTVLPYVFYIGSTNMAFSNMNVLEYLMFITGNSRKKSVERQEYLLEFLMNTGLGYICLTPIGMLTPEEKSIVILAAAVLSDSMLLIMNLPRLQYDQKQIDSIKKLTSRFHYSGRTFIFNTECYSLAQSISTHFCYLYKGEIIYLNSLKNFLDEFDRVIYSLSAENNDYMVQILRTVLPQFEYRIEDNFVQVIDNTSGKFSAAELFATLGTYGLKPDYVFKNEKNIKNALKGMKKIYDIQ